MARAFELREYQQFAISKLTENLLELPYSNPLIVLPTGSGKSYVMSEGIRRLHLASPASRTLVLTHRTELVRQDLKHLRQIAPDLSAAVCCADITPRELTQAGVSDLPPHKAQAVIGTVQTVASRLLKNPSYLGDLSYVWVDEAHWVPHRLQTNNQGDSQPLYLRALQRAAPTPDTRIIGMTATPWRTNGGHLCDFSTRNALSRAYTTNPGALRYDPASPYVFNYVTYDGAQYINEMIRDGYLVRVTSKLSDICDLHGQPEPNQRLSTDFGKIKIDSRTNDYDVHELEAEMLTSLDEAIAIILSMPPEVTQRKRWIAFLPAQGSAIRMAEKLTAAGIPARACTYQYPAGGSMARRKVIEDFKAGKFTCLCSVEKFAEGFDVPNIDLMLMMRHTKSARLYIQMLGRGMRQDPDHPKRECFALDLVGVVEDMGSIDKVYRKARLSGKLMPDPDALHPSIKEIACVHCRSPIARNLFPRKPELYKFCCPHCDERLYSLPVSMATASGQDGAGQHDDRKQIQDNTDSLGPVGLAGQDVDLLPQYSVVHVQNRITIDVNKPYSSVSYTRILKYPDVTCTPHVSQNGNYCVRMRVGLRVGDSPVDGQHTVPVYIPAKICTIALRRLDMPDDLSAPGVLETLCLTFQEYTREVELVWDQTGRYHDFPRLVKFTMAP